ncbi:IS3 family transposase [Brevibacillus sp. FSL L8-0520]|uniref:IS3 family transposase n=1 Tax=Brevibacillus TaxID=55080 RepID=UPI0030D231E8
MTRYLCKLACVSASGYYRWRTAEEVRQLREDADQHDFRLIKEHFDALRGKAGALVIKMRIERVDGIIMNHKKIRRLMRKYNRVCQDFCVNSINQYMNRFHPPNWDIFFGANRVKGVRRSEPLTRWWRER